LALDNSNELVATNSRIEIDPNQVLEKIEVSSEKVRAGWYATSFQTIKIQK